MVVQVIRPLVFLLLVLVGALGVDTQLMVEVNLPIRILNNNNMVWLSLDFLSFTIALWRLYFFYGRSLASFWMFSGFITAIDCYNSRDREAKLNSGMTVSGYFFLFFSTHLFAISFPSRSLSIESRGSDQPYYSYHLTVSILLGSL